MRTKLIILALMMVPMLATAQIKEKDFVKGADVGFLTNQERQGVVFHDRQGRERECLELLNEEAIKPTGLTGLPRPTRSLVSSWRSVTRRK